MFLVENVFDDVELGVDGWRVRGSTMPFECRKHFISFLILAFPDEQTRRVGQEGAHGIDTECEEDLEG